MSRDDSIDSAEDRRSALRLCCARAAPDPIVPIVTIAPIIMGVTKHPLFVEDGGAGAIPPDRALIRRLQASFARAAAKDGELTERFYARLFESHPELRALFPNDMSEQREKLFATLAEVVAHLHDPSSSKRVLEELGREHAGFGALESHYPIVCDMLARALADVSGEAWTAEIDSDWRRALEMLSAIMIAGARGQRV
jgi:hemoglobin-like flavoprotein